MKKRFVAILLTVLMIFATTANAVTGVIPANRNYKDIKITLNGTAVKTEAANEPFIIDGTTFLPVRAIAEALGLTVEWDAATNTVKLTNGYTKPTSTTTYGRNNPVPINTAKDLNTTYKYSPEANEHVNLRVVSTIRGEEAWKLIKESNMFNTPAPAGYEYLIATIAASVWSTGDNGYVSFSQYDFTAFSSNNEEYDKSFVVLDGAIDGKVYPGGHIGGKVAFCVKTTDTAPKMAYGVEYDGTGGVWFALY